MNVICLRISDALRQRLLNMVQTSPPSLTHRGRLKRSAVMREALARGLDCLEKEMEDARRQEKRR